MTRDYLLQEVANNEREVQRIFNAQGKPVPNYAMHPSSPASWTPEERAAHIIAQAIREANRAPVLPERHGCNWYFSFILGLLFSAAVLIVTHGWVTLR